MKKQVLGLLSVVSISGLLTASAVAAGEKNEGFEGGDKQQPAEVYCTVSYVKFKKNCTFSPDVVFMDDIPEQYSGWKITQYQWPNLDRSLEVKVKKAGVVTLTMKPNRASFYLKEKGWAEVGKFTMYHEFKDEKRTYIIMEKYLEEGEYAFEPVGRKKWHPLLIIPD